MKHVYQLWHEDDGVLSFEWVILVTLLTIGIVGGISAARDGIIDELGDIAQGAIALDQSYYVDYAPDIIIHAATAGMGGSDSQFVDNATNFDDDSRAAINAGQLPESP
jgi:Flp pilus assembly pilin Flp